MKANSIRSFAIGLLIATSMCGAAYFLSPKKVKSEPTVEKLTEAEMKSKLAANGYKILTEEEWNEQLAANEKAEEPKEEEKEEGKEEESETVVYRTILTVSSGMTSIDVGEALQKANIIDSAIGFFKEVENKGLANGLRPGTYEVDSEMTVDEIISTVFK
ncbi:hypothetical protein [Bacillus sp. FJAT-50079]|uniref:hypothetical protein n=1 Tax=Bacillus sp. FJAT-50079 TaxID=2833577 RepID=UPI001BC9E94C|nr:hypothetical protein [Bacillus sp. FJAT-50079]MBS4207484.1 hypothetical protein [Bacillus sp. FJAT-50079]